MRIVVFVGSVIEEDEKELDRLGKRLKKEKVSIDVVNFGEVESNRDKLTALVSAANGTSAASQGGSAGHAGSSHLVSVPAGVSLRDSLISSPIIVGEDGRGAIPLGSMDFGLDPNEDPELLLALRVSLEDQRHRQETSRQVVPVSDGTEVAAEQSAIDDEETLLQRLLHESSAVDAGAAIAESDISNVGSAGGGFLDNEEVDFANMTEEDQIAYALAMSMQQHVEPDDAGGAASGNVAEAMDVAGGEAPGAKETTGVDPDKDVEESAPRTLDEMEENAMDVAEKKKDET